MMKTWSDFVIKKGKKGEKRKRKIPVTGIYGKSIYKFNPALVMNDVSPFLKCLLLFSFCAIIIINHKTSPL